MSAQKMLGILKRKYPRVKYYLNFSKPLELMVAAILSPMVRDEVVNASTPALFKRFRSAKAYSEASASEIGKYINKISFYRTKAKNIKGACKIIVEKHGGKVPSDVNELRKLPGIGRKVAVAIVINGFNKIVGIPCDTHCIRLSYRMGWTKNKNPDKIEKDLMKLFPRREWKRLPWILKAHGRALCKAPVPVCSKCPLNKICPKKGVGKKV